MTILSIVLILVAVGFAISAKMDIRKARKLQEAYELRWNKS